MNTHLKYYKLSSCGYRGSRYKNTLMVLRNGNPIYTFVVVCMVILLRLNEDAPPLRFVTLIYIETNKREQSNMIENQSWFCDDGKKKNNKTKQVSSNKLMKLEILLFLMMRLWPLIAEWWWWWCDGDDYYNY